MRIVVEGEGETFDCMCCHGHIEEGVDYCPHCGAGIQWVWK